MMSDEWLKQYDVFISYAHADAAGPAGAEMVRQIKAEIEAALQPVSAHPFAFLDSEALKWGMDWNSRITECISKCRVFVYLLSPNYLRSEYCQRERLIWAQLEIGKGCLNRTTRPIYYIDLQQTGTVQKQEIEEHQICQTNAKPFFASVEQVKDALVANRIEQIREIAASIGKQVAESRQSEESVCTIRPGFNRFFVGRLKELAELNALICENRKIPVVSGGPGMGKTELAVAYAYAYAEKFPQGRFMIPMQGVSTWTEAMDKMVSQIKVCMHGESLEDWGFPEDFDKREPDERRRIAFTWLWRRAEKGQLLLLLDNLEDMDLLSDSQLRELTDQAGLPDALRIIATTRLNQVALPGGSIPVRFETVPLKESDALELFCRIGENRFPFARWPMCGGKLALDDVPRDQWPDPKVIEDTPKEYAALKEIIRMLNGHAWSLEIVAGFMAENFEHYSFQGELEDLQKNPMENLTGSTYRGSGVQSPEALLEPTLKKLREFDRLAEDFGKHILWLAAAASFFPPEQVPRDALEGIWKQQFGDDRIVYDGGRKKAFACLLALEQLRKYRILNGEGGLFKMHRLTRDVRQNSLSAEEKAAIADVMRKYLDDFRAKTPHMTTEQILPWLGWAQECLEKIEPLRNNTDFLWSCINLIDNCRENNLYGAALPLLEIIRQYAESTRNEDLNAGVLFTAAGIHSDLNQFEQAENEYLAALAFYRQQAEQYPDHYNSSLADTLNSLAILHMNFNRYEQAENEYQEALTIRRQLAEKDSDKIKPDDVAMTLNNLAILHHDLNQFEQAKNELQEALAIRRLLAKQYPDYYNPVLADTLNSLANLHSDLNQNEQAENEYRETLTLYRQMAEQYPDKFNTDVALVLHNLAYLHHDLNQFEQAENEYLESLTLYRQMAEQFPDKFNPIVATLLNNLANLHSDLNQNEQAGNEYLESLDIRRRLAEQYPDKFNPDVANSLNNLANLHKNLNQFEQAENEYQEVLTLYRQAAEQNPDKFTPFVATSLNNLANLHSNLNQFEQAENELQEALAIRRRLAEQNPDKFNPDVAGSLNNLANLHSDLNQFEPAENEYQEVLTLYRQAAEQNPDKFNSYVADSLNNLAVLHSDLNQFEQAENEHQEALAIRRLLAEQNPDKFNPDVADSLNNLANLHKDLNQYELAENEYHEVLAFYRQQSERNPDRFNPGVARTLYNLAVLHQTFDRNEEAEPEYLEALTIQRQLAEQNPDRFNPDVAASLNNLAVLHIALNQFEQAENEYLEALAIRRLLAEQNPDKFNPDVAMTLNDLANLHNDLNQFEQADNEHQEALAIRRLLAEQNPDKFTSAVADSLNNLANLHQDLERYEEAEPEYLEALNSYRQSAEQDPDRFNPFVALTLFNLAVLHSCLNMEEQSQLELDEAVEIAQRYPENPYCQQILEIALSGNDGN